MSQSAFITRLVVGLVALAIISVPIWLGGPVYVATVLAIALIGGHEFYGLLSAGGYHPASKLGLLWLVSITFAGVQPASPLLHTILGAGLVLTFVYSFFQHDQPITTWIATSIGAIYFGTMMGQIVALRFLSDGVWWLWFGLFVTWSNDTMAYFVGGTLGKRKLWPRLSPKKTWEGTIGGWIGAAVMGAILGFFLPIPISALGGSLIGFGCGILGLMGDLSMSVVKRQVGVKDSGHFFPGHGGMLDRLDSALFTLPFVYQMALWFTSSYFT